MGIGAARDRACFVISRDGAVGPLLTTMQRCKRHHAYRARPCESVRHAAHRSARTGQQRSWRTMINDDDVIDLIGGCYAAARDGARWPAMLARLAQVFAADQCVL